MFRRDTFVRRFICGLLFVFLQFVANANPEARITRSQYIDQWKDEAIYQMVKYKIPASITLAQGILESGDGNSELSKKSNNHFGIKCHSDWNGKTTYHDDDKRGECFRKYDHARHSYEDHSDFLLRNRYSDLFNLKITDYKGWAKGLKKAGYATNPKYATLLIRLIEDNKLYEYDNIGVEMIKKGEMPEVIAEKEEKTKKERSPKPASNEGEVVVIKMGYEIKVSANDIKYIQAKEGDSFKSLAQDLDMMPWQLVKYNDLKKSDRLTDGQKLYLQPKRSRARTNYHQVQEGETMWSISQKYGVKLNKLYKRNGLIIGEQPKSGTKLKLR